jgi:hypothetical protein
VLLSGGPSDQVDGEDEPEPEDAGPEGVLGVTVPEPWPTVPDPDDPDDPDESDDEDDDDESDDPEDAPSEDPEPDDFAGDDDRDRFAASSVRESFR